MAEKPYFEFSSSELNDLQAVAAGTRPSFTHYQSMTEEKLAEVCRRLQNQPNLKTISLKPGPMTRAGVVAIGEMLKSNPQLTSFTLDSSQLDGKSFRILAAALKNHTELTTLNLSNNNLGNDGAATVAQLMNKLPSILTLNLTGNHFDDKGAVAIADALAKNTTLGTIQLTNPRITSRGRIALANSLRENRTLTNLDLGWVNSIDPQHKAAMAQILRECGHKNLGSFSPTIFMWNDATSLTKRNSDQAKAAIKRFVPVVKKDKADTADTTLNDLTLRDFHAVEERMPLIKNRLSDYDIFGYGYYGYGYGMGSKPRPTKAQALSAYEEAKAQLPKASVRSNMSLNNLFKANEHGFSPIDNPDTWKQPAKLFEALAKAEVDQDFLNRQGPKGMSFLECAITAAPAEFAVSGLNRLGFHLRSKELLDDEGKPNETLKLFIERGEVDKLFTVGNWRSANPGELKMVFNALKNHAKPAYDAIPNRTSLMAILNLKQEPGPSYGVAVAQYKMMKAAEAQDVGGDFTRKLTEQRAQASQSRNR